MSWLSLVLAVLSSVALSALAFSFFALFQARALMRTAAERGRERQAQEQAGLDGLRGTVDALSAQLHDLQQSNPAGATATAPRAGLNLSKRSQALRMHRRGDPPGQIASDLDIPLQEVELLIKVHKIVISNI